MSFHEKSSWVMVLSLLVSSALYFFIMLSMSQAGNLAAPNLPVLIVFTIVLTVLATIGHILIAALKPSEAIDTVDEREQQFFAKAKSIASNVLAVGIFISLFLFIFSTSGNLLFYMVLGSLIVSQLTEDIMKIVFYRKAFY